MLARAKRAQRSWKLSDRVCWRCVVEFPTFRWWMPRARRLRFAPTFLAAFGPSIVAAHLSTSRHPYAHANGLMRRMPGIEDAGVACMSQEILSVTMPAPHDKWAHI